MNNKALKQYIENKYGVKVVQIKNRKLAQKLYIVCVETNLDMWSTCYELFFTKVFKNLSEIVDCYEYKVSCDENKKKECEK